jgi:hypothetical protein
LGTLVLTTMSSQTTVNNPKTSSSTDQEDVGSLGRFTRTLSSTAKGYFTPSKKDEQRPTSAYKSQPTSTPGTPAVGDVVAKLTPFERFLSLGKTRKDGEIEFPPAYWSNENRDSKAANHPISPEISECPSLYLRSIMLKCLSTARQTCHR